MRILNLYAGIGGNRKLWGDEHEIVAVEYDERIARAYRHFFPGDTVIVADAHQYLREHYHEFDFIWSSPPCQSHSRIRFERAVKFLGSPPIYPDMRLYEEIIFLSHYAPDRVRWCVENVMPYYGTLVPPTAKIGRHPYWANFPIPVIPRPTEKLRSAQIPELQARHGFDLSDFSLPDKRQILRNVVDPEVGLHILRAAERSTAQP